MIDPRPSFTEIAHGEAYARRIRRARALADGKLTRTAAAHDAALWDGVVAWAGVIYQVAGAWPKYAVPVDQAATAAREAASGAERRAVRDRTNDRTHHDLAALATALEHLATAVAASPSGTTAPILGKVQHLIPADPAGLLVEGGAA